MQSNQFLAVVLGLLAFALLNTGMGTQKYAAEVWFSGKTILKTAENRKKLGIWFFGLFQVGIAMILLSVAVSMSNISTISPLSGFGLVVLAVFSYYILGEQLTKKEIIAVGIVLTGTCWLGIHLQKPANQPVDESLLWIVLGVTLLPPVFGCLYSYKNNWKWAGPIFSSCGAIIASFALIFPKLFSNEISLLESNVSNGLIAITKNPYVYLYILFNLAAMVPLQIAYRYGKAFVVIPIYSAMYMILPILFGVILFEEHLFSQQWLGILIVIAGVITLTMKSRSEPSL